MANPEDVGHEPILLPQPRYAQILTTDSASNIQSRVPGDQRPTTEFTDTHRKENSDQPCFSVSFPGATPARRVGSFRGHPLVTIFLAVVIHPP